MPEIKQYTRQILPQQLNQTRAAPSSFGGNTQGMEMQARALQQSAQAFNDTADVIQQVQTKRQNRIDTVERARSADEFNQWAQTESIRLSTEGDLTDPQISKQFKEQLRQKASEVLGKHAGSAESRAALEASIINLEGQYSMQMEQNSIKAQRNFIMTRAGTQINELANRVRQDPSQIGSIFLEADKIIQDYAPALLPEDELDMVASAQEQIAISALQSYTDMGMYQEAKELIDSNPTFMSALNPQTQRQVVSQIQAGLAEQDRSAREMRSKINSVRAAATELGVQVDAGTLFKVATGIDTNATPMAKVEQFAQVMGKTTEELTPSIIAKIGFGVDLPESNVDFNKDYAPDGSLTPKGIAGQIKVPFEKAAAAKMYQEKVLGAISLFRQDGNKQALLSAMISFQKALDEGAVVREGDIALQREAQGISDRIKAISKPGQVVGDELVDEMETTMNDFTRKSLESAKSIIDPYVEEASAKGYRPLDYGVPQEAYQNVFGGIKNPDQGKSKINKADLTLDEFLGE